MSWYGPLDPGPTTLALTADRMYARDFTVKLADGLVKVMAYLDGGGAGAGQQQVRAAIYNADTRALIDFGDPLTILAGDPPGWVDLRFGAMGKALTVENVRVCLHAGPVGGVVRTRTDPGAGKAWPDTFADGADDTCPASPSAVALPSISMLTTTFWDPTNPREATDLHYSRYAFSTAQTIFRHSTADRRTQQFATAEWYGAKLDPEQGSNALVRSDGPLADLVGERLLISNPGTPRSVAVYCHAENAEVVTDISLSRRAFLALDYLSTEELDVIVEVLVD